MKPLENGETPPPDDMVAAEESGERQMERLSDRVEQAAPQIDALQAREQRNQCDGCLAGYAITKNDGFHRYSNGLPFMSCTSERYAASNQQAASAAPQADAPQTAPRFSGSSQQRRKQRRALARSLREQTETS